MDPANSISNLCILSREFRLWQELARLIREERLRLIDCDFPALENLANQKTRLLQNLASQQRILDTHLAVDSAAQQTDNTRFPRIVNKHEDENQMVSCSISRLINGIRSLADQINELAQGNYALAECTMKHVWVLQKWIQHENQKSLPGLKTSLLAASSLHQLVMVNQLENGPSELSRHYDPTRVYPFEATIPNGFPAAASRK